MKKRPVLVTILSCVLIAAGIAGLVYHAGEYAASNKLEYALVLFVRVLAIVAGLFMLRGSNWARWLAILWIAAHVIISAFHPMSELAIHIVVFAMFAFVLFRSESAEYFRGSEGR